MTKRPADELGSGRSAKLPTGARRRHLYLVLDDWELGYSIRKVDLSSDTDSDEADEPWRQQAAADDDDDDDGKTEQRLPPAVFRLEAPRSHSGLFAAMGTKIMATHHTRSCNTILMFDVHTRALTFAPRQESPPNRLCNAYVQVDGKLFSLDPASFEMLHPPSTAAHRPSSASAAVRRRRPCRPMPQTPTWMVVARASGTTAPLHHRSRRAPQRTDHLLRLGGSHHEAFQGRHLLLRHRDLPVETPRPLGCPVDTLGHLSACDVISVDTDRVDRQPPPAFKLSKEKLFCVDDAAEQHIGATLVYMGGGSRFCLGQCLSVDDREGGV
ncbi:hypothetical protein ACP70R_031249 [Stipagrostis hirtigluma subsp. patula]